MMDDINLNIGGDPAAIAQLAVAPAVDEPLEGVQGHYCQGFSFNNFLQTSFLQSITLICFNDHSYLAQ
jgi:hypothetical protein